MYKKEIFWYYALLKIIFIHIKIKMKIYKITMLLIDAVTKIGCFDSYILLWLNGILSFFTDYQHESNSIEAHTKLVQFDPSYITDPNQLNAFQLDVPPYQFFNGTGNPSSDVIDISSYSASGLAPSNAIQQQTSNTADAKSNDVTQTMEFVSQGKILDSFISSCYI